MACASGDKSEFIFLSVYIMWLFVFSFEGFLKLCYMSDGRMCDARRCEW